MSSKITTGAKMGKATSATVRRTETARKAAKLQKTAHAAHVSAVPF